MRSASAGLLCSIIVAISCAAPPSAAARRTAALPSSVPAPIATSSLAPTITATPTSPPPTALPIAQIDTIDCGEVETFLERTRAARRSAAGLTEATEPAPTRVPANAVPPPLGQFLLNDSPINEYRAPAYMGFLTTTQSLGPFASGQMPDLAASTGLAWGFERDWTGSSPGGFANFVYEFESASGAFQFDEGAARRACLYGGALFEVTGIPGAIGQRLNFGFPTYVARVTFLKGKRRYAVQVSSMTAIQLERVSEAARIAIVVAK